MYSYYCLPSRSEFLTGFLIKNNGPLDVNFSTIFFTEVLNYAFFRMHFLGFLWRNKRGFIAEFLHRKT